MCNISILEELNQSIEYYLNRNGQYPSRIILGYKTYTELMHQKKFSDGLKHSAIEPNKRKYRKIKIKLTQDDHQLELR